MKSGHKTRLLALATQLVTRKFLVPPLLVFADSDTLPQTPPQVIAAATAAGRNIVRVHFVKASNGGLGAQLDYDGPHVVWSRPEDAPMTDVCAEVNGELKIVERRPLERPVTTAPELAPEGEKPCPARGSAGAEVM
jgi:hypothetical protein